MISVSGVKPNSVGTEQNASVGVTAADAVAVSPAPESGSDAVRVAISETGKEAKKETEKAPERSAASASTTVRFQVKDDERGNRKINFQVVDRSTGEVIRQFPPNELPDLLEKSQARSLLVDDVA